jgi:N-acetylglutamate synthase-like GNAT family acetyltransferase
MSSEVIIRDLRFCDISDVQLIVLNNWNSEIAYKARLEMQEMFNSSKWPPHYYVAEVDGRVVGCGGFRRAWIMSDTYEMIWINIDKDFQGRGIGWDLTQRRITRIKELNGSLIMLMTNKPEFFEQFYFNRAAIFDNQHLMTRHLNTVKLNGVL